MSHLLIVELPGGNDTDIFAAALHAGHRFTLLTADARHYRAQAEVAPWLARAEAVIEVPGFAIGDAMASIASCKFDAIVCLQDLRIVETALIAQALGLRHLNPATASLARNKAAVRSRLADAGIAQPPYAVTTGREDLIATVDRLGLPLIVKPVDGFGSQHIFALHDAADLVLLRALAGPVAAGPGDYGLGVAAQGQLLVERLFDGPVIGCDVMRVGGRQVLLGVNHKIMAAPPSFAILGGCFTAHCGQFAALDAWLARLLDAVGFDCGAAHVELVMTDEGPQLVEINPRLVGARIARLVGAALGRSVHADLIALHLAGTLPPPAVEPRHAATRWLLAPEPGVLAQIDWPDCDDPRLVGIVPNAHVGDTVRPALDNADRLAMVITAGADRAEIEALAETIVAGARARVSVPVPCTG